MTNILAPFVNTENGSKFYLNGRVYAMTNEGVMTETEDVTGLAQAIRAFESFQFTTNAVKWFHGPVKFVYDLNENKFKHNESLIEGNTFTNHVLSAGMVRYEHKATAELFESLPSLVENFIVLDFVSVHENNNIRVELFKVDEKVYVSRFNSETRLAKFFEAANANEALEYVKENTNQDATTFLAELLEGEAKELAETAATIAEYQDMIAFLKDQRGLLAEADKTIEEIKEADTLINTEIQNWENKIAELRS